MFPKNNIWNTPVDTLPVHENSVAYINMIGMSAPLRCDDTIPINFAPPGTERVPVSTENTESDPGFWPIPSDAMIEPGSDGHLLVICEGVLYEMYLATKQGNGWTCYCCAKWDLNSHALRPATWTSADAAGLPIAPGVVQYSEILAGEIPHALRCSVPDSDRSRLWPARHIASSIADPNRPPMGLRLRLKSSFIIDPTLSPMIKTILRCLRTYGVMIGDNGMPFGMQHDGDPRWNINDTVVLHQITGAAMEAVDVSSLMANPDLGLAGPMVTSLAMFDACNRATPVSLGPGLAIVDGTVVATGGLPAMPPTPLPAGQICAYYMIGGKPPYNWNWITIDDSLNLTVDSKGHAHIGVAKA